MSSNQVLTEDQVKFVIARALPFEGSISIVDFELTSHSEIRIGFLGEHQNLTVRLRRKHDAEVETYRFFVKAMPESSEHQSLFINRLGLFDREAKYFNKLLPELRRNYVGPDWSPKCLLANSSVIVLEDMRTRGYSMLDDKMFDTVHLKSALRAQARVHAASILAEARTGKPASEICPEACSEVIYVKSDRYNVIIDLIEKIAQRLKLDGRRLRPGYNRGLTRLHDPINPGKRVISHGDAWPNNCLFRDELQPPECVLVDYQLVRYAPRMYDVAQLVYFSTTHQLRRTIEHETVAAYHQELCAILERNDPELPRPSLDLLQEEYEDARCSALLGAAVYYPIIFMTQKILLNLESTPDLIYQKIFLRETNDFVMQLYDEHEEYARKLDDLTSESVEYFKKIGIEPAYS